MEKLLQNLQERNQKSLAEKSAKWGINFAGGVPNSVQASSAVASTITWLPIIQKPVKKEQINRAVESNHAFR
jgi:hypothetical protein